MDITDKKSICYNSKVADKARRLPRNFIVDRKYRLPSGRRYFCYMAEMMMSGGNPEPRLFRQLKCTAIQSFLQPKLPIKTLPLYIKRWDTLTLVFMRVCVARLVVLTTKGEGKRRAASDYIYDVAYLKISAIIKAEIADAVRRLPRIMFERNRRPSIGGFCVNRRSYFLSETMIAIRTPKANIKDSAS